MGIHCLCVVQVQQGFGSCAPFVLMASVMINVPCIRRAIGLKDHTSVFVCFSPLNTNHSCF